MIFSIQSRLVKLRKTVYIHIICDFFFGMVGTLKVKLDSFAHFTCPSIGSSCSVEANIESIFLSMWIYNIETWLTWLLYMYVHKYRVIYYTIWKWNDVVSRYVSITFFHVFSFFLIIFFEWYVLQSFQYDFWLVMCYSLKYEIILTSISKIAINKYCNFYSRRLFYRLST